MGEPPRGTYDAFEAARLALQRLGPDASVGDVFSATCQNGPFLGGFVEVYVELRPWEATHTAIHVAPELTHIIMQRKPYEPQPALDVVSRAPIGSLTCDREAMTEARWRRVEGYQAVRGFGYSQASALKLATTGNGARREHMYLALFRAPDAAPLSSDEQAVLERLHPVVRDTLHRLAVPLLARSSMLTQIVREQGLGAVSLSPSRAIQDADSTAFAMASRYAPSLGVCGRRDVLRDFVDRLLEMPIDPDDGRRHIRHPDTALYLEATVHLLDAATYDLPEPRLLVLLRESKVQGDLRELGDQLMSLPAGQRKIATFLVATGYSYKQIAAEARLSEGTVRTQVERIYRALGVHSRAELSLRLRGSL